VEQGHSVGEVVESAGPAIHFSRKALVQAALSAWSAKRLERTIGQLGDVALAVRQHAVLAHPIAQRALMSIAGAARRKD
jgi:DNA polymerase-3 subunit delta